MVSAAQGGRVATRRLGAAPSDDRREVVARLDDAAEVGRRGIVDFRLHDAHQHALNAHRRAIFGVSAGDGVLSRVDVHFRPGVGQQRGDGEMIAEDDGANRRAGGGEDRAEGFRLRGCDVGVEGVGDGVRGLVHVTCI